MANIGASVCFDKVVSSPGNPAIPVPKQNNGVGYFLFKGRKYNTMTGKMVRWGRLMMGYFFRNASKKFFELPKHVFKKGDRGAKTVNSFRTQWLNS